MIDALTAQLEGEYKVVNAHSCNVRACVDCRYCWEHPACSIQDGWQEIDSYLRECDNVVIASPVYFVKSPVRCLACSAGFRFTGQPRPSAMKSCWKNQSAAG